MLTALEEKKIPLACKVEDLVAYLKAGSIKNSFGTETDRILTKLTESGRKKCIKSFQNVFALSVKKIECHLDKHPAYEFYKAVRVFDPRQLPIVDHDIAQYDLIPGLKNPSPELLEEWLICKVLFLLLLICVLSGRVYQCVVDSHCFQQWQWKLYGCL